MPTTIDGTFNATRCESESFTRKYWRMRRNFTNAVSDACSTASKWTKDTAMPAIAQGAESTLKAVDGGCVTVNRAVVDFLVKYPGIAMTLSPQTIVRMAVAEHYKEMSNADCHAGDAVESVEHFAVNIMQ